MLSPRSKRSFRTFLLALSAMMLAAGNAPAKADGDDDGAAGAVYTMNNAAAGNTILRFARAADGTLTPGGSFSTGGAGSGGGLGNQGALVISGDGRWLYAVNAGSNDISVFSVKPGGLELTDRVASGGTRPVSLAIHHDLLYVLNAGDTGNISGFTIQRKGRLAPLTGSTRPLSGPATAPAQISFNPEGTVLVVTEKATNLIDTYVVGENGLTSGPYINHSVRPTPFGFAFDRKGDLLVSEAVGGAPNGASLSSYAITPEGHLDVISPAVASAQTAACWVAVTKNGKFAYVTNTGSGTVTGYKVGRDGSVALRDPSGSTANTGTGSLPIDLAFANNSQYLYTLNNGTHTLGAFRVQADGGLVAISGAAGLPAGTNGLAAH